MDNFSTGIRSASITVPPRGHEPAPLGHAPQRPAAGLLASSWQGAAPPVPREVYALPVAGRDGTPPRFLIDNT